MSLIVCKCCIYSIRSISYPVAWSMLFCLCGSQSIQTVKIYVGEGAGGWIGLAVRSIYSILLPGVVFICGSNY